jgi:phosphatidylglycerol---prolipoprotein diacylglyceryl transferase
MHKVAFTIGSFTVYWYGVLVAAGFLAGLWTASRRGLREGLPADKVFDVGPWLILGALIGSRLLYVINHWRKDFAGGSLWDIINIRQGGLVFFGGLIGAALAVATYLRWKRLPVWKMADVLAPSIALGAFFGRLGCLMNGCCFGRPTSLPWGICFPETHETLGLPVHPTEIYDSLLNLALYGALAWLYRHKRFDGQVFATHLIGYSLCRSFVECFRGDYAADQYVLGGHLTPAQFLGVGTFLIGGVLYWVLRRYAAGHKPGTGHIPT